MAHKRLHIHALCSSSSWIVLETITVGHSYTWTQCSAWPPLHHSDQAYSCPKLFDCLSYVKYMLEHVFFTFYYAPSCISPNIFSRCPLEIGLQDFNAQLLYFSDGIFMVSGTSGKVGSLNIYYFCDFVSKKTFSIVKHEILYCRS